MVTHQLQVERRTRKNASQSRSTTEPREPTLSWENALSYKSEVGGRPLLCLIARWLLASHFLLPVRLCLCVGASVEVPVLLGTYWPDNVRQVQHICDYSLLESSADGLLVLWTVGLIVNTTTCLHPLDQGMFSKTSSAFMAFMKQLCIAWCICTWGMGHSHSQWREKVCG